MSHPCYIPAPWIQARPRRLGDERHLRQLWWAGGWMDGWVLGGWMNRVYLSGSLINGWRLRYTPTRAGVKHYAPLLAARCTVLRTIRPHSHTHT